METTWLARQFIKQREIIEAAETPFAKLAVFVLPIIAPLVPAFMTGLHLYKLFLEIFSFPGMENVSRYLSFGLSGLIALVLELLGYVGAISFIRSLFRWIGTREDEYLLPAFLNFLSYIFYLVAMWAINYQLGKHFGTDPLVNNIIALLSFITVPTGLLAANHLNDLSEEEKEERLRKEKSELSLKKYEIKHGGTFQQVSKKVPESSKEELESSKKVPDWRFLKQKLSRAQLETMANWTPDQMRKEVEATGFTYKTISNYRLRAREELGLK